MLRESFPERALVGVQETIGRVSKEQADLLKPKFHITGATGWINDPNGMFQNKDGAYHVFYQVSIATTEGTAMLQWRVCDPKAALHVRADIPACSVAARNGLWFRVIG